MVKTHITYDSIEAKSLKQYFWTEIRVQHEKTIQQQ